MAARSDATGEKQNRERTENQMEDAHFCTRDSPIRGFAGFQTRRGDGHCAGWDGRWCQQRCDGVRSFGRVAEMGGPERRWSHNWSAEECGRGDLRLTCEQP